MSTAATDEGLVSIALPGKDSERFDRQVKQDFADYEVMRGGKTNEQAERELRAYLEGRLREFKVELCISGTPFQREVLQQVSRIPYGKTRTYGEIAASIEKPKASRAVGSANGSNRLPLIIPCHRVVASVGLGGYGGGLELKRKLLEMEGAL
ncbi:MAG: methylated-DNA--[protein]-cysteine S-methyltransferase [bacterium]|nr:methylated-DNA--[protein]-cysteine S-methyltransferase [bacterium]